MTATASIPTMSREYHSRQSQRPVVKGKHRFIPDPIVQFINGVKDRVKRAFGTIVHSQWGRMFGEMFMWMSAFFAAYMAAVIVVCLVLALVGLL